MVRMAQKHVDKYGSTKKIEDWSFIEFYLRFFFPYVRNNKKLWESFLKYSSLSEEQAARCLTYGTAPSINIYDMNKGGPHGEFDPATPDDIYINYAKPGQLRGATNFQAAHERAKLFESTLLHELCHWGRHQTGTPDDDFPDGNDSGRHFQMEAYNDFNKPHLG